MIKKLGAKLEAMDPWPLSPPISKADIEQ